MILPKLNPELRQKTEIIINVALISLSCLLISCGCRKIEYNDDKDRKTYKYKLISVDTLKNYYVLETARKKKFSYLIMRKDSKQKPTNFSNGDFYCFSSFSWKNIIIMPPETDFSMQLDSTTIETENGRYDIRFTDGF